MEKKRLKWASRNKNSADKAEMFLFVLAVSLLSVFWPAQMHAQNAKTITINKQNVPFSEVVREIESQTDYTFMYSTDAARSVGRVSVNVTSGDVKRVLDAALTGKPFAYKIDGKVIILSVRNQQQTPASQRAPKVGGVVTDASGRPVSGAVVLAKGTQVGAATDAQGRFQIEMPAGVTTLVISYVGKETREVVTGERTSLDITLNDMTQAVSDVVVTGMFTKSRESYTGAVTSISKKELEAASNTNLITAIGNIDPSFRITENLELGSDPNQLPDITVRGRTSMDANVRDLQEDVSTTRRANLPLFILDGFEVSLQRVMDMDNELVESVTLLKDASATALYGARGANGIVVITSRRPQAGRLMVSYRGTIQIEVPDFTSYNLMNSREKLEYEVAAGCYFYSNDPSYTNNFYNQLLKEKYNERLLDVERGVDTYWLKYPVRTGVGNRHSLRIDGGGEAFKYAGSIAYNNIEGVMKESSRNTFSGDLFFQYELKNIKFQNDLAVNYNTNYNSPYGNFSDYATASPLYAPYDDEGKLKKMLNESGVASGYNVPPMVGNPLYNASLPYRDDGRYTNIQDNFAIEWNITPDLFLRGRFGITTQDGRTDKYLSREHTSFETDAYKGENYKLRGSYTYATSYSSRYESDLTLNYNKTFAEVHQLYAGLNYRLSEEQFETYTITAVGYSASNKTNFSLGGAYMPNARPTGTEGHTRTLGATANVNYTYDRRYFVDLSGKLEGSSAFGANDRTAPFWSAGLGWNIHNEAFFKTSKAINSLRLRGSYGTTGSQNFNPYQALTAYRYFTVETYKNWIGAYMMDIGNPDLTWQQTNMLNVGFEAALLGDNVRLTVDAYNYVTDNTLTDINMPTASGFNSYKANLGKVRNRGFEINANVYLIRNPHSGITWSVGGDLVHNQNEILKISNSLEFLNKELMEYSGANPSFLYKEGQSMNTIFVVRSLGIDPATGKEIYLDKDGNRTNVWAAEDKVACGVKEPKINGNLRTMFRWKNLSFNAIFAYRAGGYTYNSTIVGKLENISREAAWNNLDRRAYYERWHNPGDVALYKDIKNFNPTQASSRFVMKENTFQMKSINVNYEFDPERLKRNLGMTYLALSFYTEDLFFISTVKQERGLNYPFARQFSVSVSARF